MCTQGTRTESDTYTPSTQAKAEADAEQVVVLNRGHILSLPSPPGDIGNVEIFLIVTMWDGEFDTGI